MKYILVLCLLLSGAFACFSQVKPVNFTDDTEMTLPLKPVDYTKIRLAKVEAFKVTRKTATVFWESIGKARPLDLPGKLSNAAFKKQAKLFARIDKITTQCSFKQNGQEYNIHCLESVRFEKLADCNECQVKVVLIIMEFRIGNQTYFVPLIESAEKITVGKTKTKI